MKSVDTFSPMIRKMATDSRFMKGLNEVKAQQHKENVSLYWDAIVSLKDLVKSQDEQLDEMKTEIEVLVSTISEKDAIIKRVKVDLDFEKSMGRNQTAIIANLKVQKDKLG